MIEIKNIVYSNEKSKFIIIYLIKRGKTMKKLLCIGGREIPRYKNGVLIPYETKEIDEKIKLLGDKNE